MTPGLVVLHGNRLEQLADAVFAWLARHPLAPLEEEVFLVQSNGMAEWLKMALAEAHGVAAAVRVELPARFLWRAYRAVLGALPPVSALDKLPLTWRVMQQLPALAAEPGFEPIAGWLGGAHDGLRRLQLAERLADLFDQYQVHRADWLRDWADGHDRLRGATGHATPVPDNQRWQPLLWRALLAALDPAEQAALRPALHTRFLQALAEGRAGALPRRVVLFGTTHVPVPVLQAIAAIGEHRQVLLAVPNPCRYHWADLIEGRELLQAARRRHALRGGRDLAALPLHELHAHGHPLLAAWGRQARDFIRQLDAFDDAAAVQARLGLPRIDFFDDTPATTMLGHVQAAIRDGVPLAEQQPAPALAADDRSIVFTIAHGPQREVEILHDQLLQLFAQPPGGRPLAPRDVVVMVPDIETFAPAIRSVFGQHARGSARHIPWGIADQSARGQQPLLVALDWLLHAPQQRFTAGELRDLLDVPAVARRLRVADDDRPVLAAWIADAGIRWGLHAEQRAALGLAAAGDGNSWAFGLRRLLLGYATGELADGFAGIQPSAEVAGLAAGLAGTLAELLQALDAWWRDAATPRAPAAWAVRLRALAATFFDPADDADRALLAALDDALAAWLEACERAAFDEAVSVDVAREAWLAALDEPALGRRFRAGGVTFCTLLPLRAIPFEVVCMLGMNDGDYPRRAPRSDFDLMALPGQARPGDRSRRDDDRQLMLDALLSARRVLSISWAGRSARDNTVQPPSVLVAQLRDHLAALWGQGAVDARTTAHPLQPFSRRYFEPASGLLTYAREWRAAHDTAEPAAAAAADAFVLPPLSIAALAQFIRNPVKAFFRHRLQVSFDDAPPATDDDEPFTPDALERWSLHDEVLRAAAAGDADVGSIVARLRRAGRLPLGGPGGAAEEALARALAPVVARWRAEVAAHPVVAAKHAVRIAHPEDPTLVLDDWLTDRRAAVDGPPVWIDLQPGTVTTGRDARLDRVVHAWVRGLVAAAAGLPADTRIVGADALLHLAAPDADTARLQLFALMAAWRDGLAGDAPLPTVLRTGLAWLADETKAAGAYEGGFGAWGDVNEPCLARLFPDFAALAGAPGFEAATRTLYAPLLTANVSVIPLVEDAGG